MQRGVLKNYTFYWFLGQCLFFFKDLTAPWGPKSRTMGPVETILPTRSLLTNKAVQRMEQILTQAAILLLAIFITEMSLDVVSKQQHTGNQSQLRITVTDLKGFVMSICCMVFYSKKQLTFHFSCCRLKMLAS